MAGVALGMPLDVFASPFFLWEAKWEGALLGPEPGNGSLGDLEGLPACPVPSLHSRGLLQWGYGLQLRWRQPVHDRRWLQQQPGLQLGRWLQFHQWPQHERQQLQRAHHLQDVVHQEELQELKGRTSLGCPLQTPTPSFPALRPAALLMPHMQNQQQEAWGVAREF